MAEIKTFDGDPAAASMLQVGNTEHPTGAAPVGSSSSSAARVQSCELSATIAEAGSSFSVGFSRSKRRRWRRM